MKIRKRILLTKKFQDKINNKKLGEGLLKKYFLILFLLHTQKKTEMQDVIGFIFKHFTPDLK